VDGEEGEVTEDETVITGERARSTGGHVGNHGSKSDVADGVEQPSIAVPRKLHDGHGTEVTMRIAPQVAIPVHNRLGDTAAREKPDIKGQENAVASGVPGSVIAGSGGTW